MLYAQIVVNTMPSDLDKIFTYGIDTALSSQAEIGKRVTVPFGKRGTLTDGYIVGFEDTLSFAENKLKMVQKIYDASPFFDEDLLVLANWMKEKYYTTLLECLKTIVPSGMMMKNYWIVEKNELDYTPALSPLEEEMLAYIDVLGGSILEAELEEAFGKNSKKTLDGLQQKNCIHMRQIQKDKNLHLQEKYAALTDACTADILDQYRRNKRLASQYAVLSLLQKGPVAYKDVLQQLHISESPVKTLIKKELVYTYVKRKKRNIIDAYENNISSSFTLTEEQMDSVNYILAAPTGSTTLIHGVTGSGKTEIYIKLIEALMSEGKQAIVLVPEISLTPQIFGRFIARFGKKVAVTHSRMSAGERYDEWQRVKDGEVAVMIGPRSAVFAPFQNLGMIIIDEEHENTYRSETTPKYDAKAVAEKRMEICGGKLVLGSATPSIESYFRAQRGEINLLALNNRINRTALPAMIVKDMRIELETGNRSMFSRQLYQELAVNLENHEQSILFLNRRGHSSFVSCRSCGSVLQCDHCNVSYTYHATGNKLMCHYCGKTIPNPEICPFCGSRHIKFFGVGTQKVEEEIHKLFPEARTVRMDMDTMTKKNSYERAIKKFTEEDADILIGTQMIAKGHDFPKVTLVGILAADLSLNIGDFRSSENTFQLITQVAGRAGRAHLEGRVLVQSYNPEHFAIQSAVHYHYQGFFQEEIALRRQMEYPPYAHLFVIVVSGVSEKNVILNCNRFHDILAREDKQGVFDILGPVPAHVSKVKNRFRWRMIVKHKDEAALKEHVLKSIRKFKTVKEMGILVSISMDPFFI